MSNKMKQTLSRIYKIRSDGALTVPEDVKKLLEWEPGGNLEYSYNTETGEFTAVKLGFKPNTPKGELENVDSRTES